MKYGAQAGRYEANKKQARQQNWRVTFGSERAVFAQPSGEPFHRFELRTDGLCAPRIQESAGPVGRNAVPEEMKLLFQQVGANGLEGLGKPLGQPSFLLIGQVLRAFEQ